MGDKLDVNSEHNVEDKYWNIVTNSFKFDDSTKTNTENGCNLLQSLLRGAGYKLEMLNKECIYAK